MKQLFTKYRERLLTGVIVVMALLNYLSYQAGVGQGEPVAVDAPARPTAAQTVPPKPTRGATATPTKVPPTGTPAPTNTPGAPTPTSTPAATGTPITGDPCSHWHPYGFDARYPNMGPFDYGINPCTMIGVYGPEFEKYLLEQNIDGMPHSSALEEPNGYTWLNVRVQADGTQDMKTTPGEGCAMFLNDPEGMPDYLTCITNATVRLHLTGDATHAKKRRHSAVGGFRVCDVLNGKPVEPCGTVITASIEDWGVKHNPYKTKFCYDDLTPRNPEGELFPIEYIGQPPYVALQPARNGFAHQFISTITFNPIIEEYFMEAFPEFPNHILRMSYNMLDAPEVFVCNDEPLPTGYLGVKFILHAVALANLPTERPFNGFTDINGYVDPGCTAISDVCMPLIITEGVPQGTPFMSYPVQFDGKQADGSPTGVIIQDFGPNP